MSSKLLCHSQSVLLVAEEVLVVRLGCVPVLHGAWGVHVVLVPQRLSPPPHPDPGILTDHGVLSFFESSIATCVRDIKNWAAKEGAWKTW